MNCSYSVFATHIYALISEWALYPVPVIEFSTLVCRAPATAPRHSVAVDVYNYKLTTIALIVQLMAVLTDALCSFAIRTLITTLSGNI